MSRLTRQRTNEQIGREYSALKKILNERDSRQHVNQHTKVDSDNRLSESKPTVKAAKQLGTSQPNAMKAETVVNAIDMLESRGNTLEADTLRKSLNKNVKKTYETVKKQYPKPEQPKPAPKPESKIKNYITLDDWKALDESPATDLLYHDGSKKFNKQEGANIEWARQHLRSRVSEGHDIG